MYISVLIRGFAKKLHKTYCVRFSKPTKNLKTEINLCTVLINIAEKVLILLSYQIDLFLYTLSKNTCDKHGKFGGTVFGNLA